MESQKKRSPIIDPNPARRKRVVEMVQQFLDDEICLAELTGVSHTKIKNYAEIGYTKFKHGRVDEAEKMFQGLIMFDHRNGYFHSVMGSIHQKKKRPVEAIVEFSQAVKINNKDIPSFVNRGEIYLRHKNFKKAAEDFRNAILIDMSGHNLFANRARSLVIALKRQIEMSNKRARRTTKTTGKRTHRKKGR